MLTKNFENVINKHTILFKYYQTSSFKGFVNKKKRQNNDKLSKQAAKARAYTEYWQKSRVKQLFTENRRC